VTRLFARIVIAAALAGTAACGSMTTPAFLQPAPRREWKPALERAQSLAATGNAVQADSVLARFQLDFPVSDGAREALYWRSLIQLQSGFVSENGPAMMLDRYMNTPGAEHAMEAATLRRVAVRVDSLSRVANALSSKVMTSNGEVSSANGRAADAKADAKAAAADNKDQDAEIRRLRNELSSAKEELERIKKRLAEPPKKPPRLSP
jgi:hypothetical protein